MTTEEHEAVKTVLERMMETEAAGHEEYEAALWQAIEGLDDLVKARGRNEELETAWGKAAYRINNVIHEIDCMRQEVA